MFPGFSFISYAIKLLYVFNGVVYSVDVQFAIKLAGKSFYCLCLKCFVDKLTKLRMELAEDMVSALIQSFVSSINAKTIFQDGEVQVEEFMKAIKDQCMGKPFEALPNSFKTFIGSQFKTIDIDGMFLASVSGGRLPIKHPLD